MPFEDRKQWKEQIDRSVRKSHPGADSSDPPPAMPATPFDLPVKEGVGSGGPPSSGPPSHRFTISMPKLSISLLKDIAWLGAAIVAGFTWAQNRASKADVDAAQQAAIETCKKAVLEAVTPLATEEKTLIAKEKRDWQRWDALDTAIAGSKALNPAGKIAFPKFGPAAEKHGEVKYPEDE